MNDPFNPHAIARLRFSAYQKSIVMKYIDNLLDWGDSLFARFTTESLNEANLLYATASDILGERPPALGGCGEAEGQSRDYNTIAAVINDGSAFLIELESLYRGAGNLRLGTRRSLAYRYAADLTALSGASTTNGRTRVNGATFRGYGWRPLGGFERAEDYGVGLARQISPAFCVPPNRELLAYWDRVENRLNNIRSCRDITGATRSPELFAPPIDPRLLVRAFAAGLTLDDVLNAISGDLPPYRFGYLIEQAKAMAAVVQSSGAALLSAIEKKDVEELTRLRTTHQQNLLRLTTTVRDAQLRDAEEGIKLVDQQTQTAQDRVDHYQGLLDGRLSPAEHTQQLSRNLASGLQVTASILDTLAAIVYLVPQLGSPFALKFGGKELGDSGGSWSEVLKNAAAGAEARSAAAGVQATFERRREEWELQRDLADHDLEQLGTQRIVAEIRRDIAKEDVDLHRRSIEQLEEEFTFYADKFSNLGLYTWLSATLQHVHREAYNSAFAMARLAEQAFRFERNEPSAVFVRPDNWDASHAGLLAGERLAMDLQAMERRFIETNYRSPEIDQSFSLNQVDPAALIALRQMGSCRFVVGEPFFDLFYPGHYRRRIRSVRLTVPCVTGPYTNVSATLTLQRSWIRVDPAANLTTVPPQRTISIATSTAHNDPGVLEFSFRDERYLPFEGAGAISEWQLELPRVFRQFDYDTINDVILHVSYTAENDGALRDAVEGQLLTTLRNTPSTRVFRLRHEFSSAFHRLLHSPANTPVPVEIGDVHFPVFLRFLRGSGVTVSRAMLVLEPAAGQSVGTVAFTLDGTTITGFTADPALGGLPSVDVTAVLGARVQGTHTFGVAAPGDLAPDAPDPNDPSVLDERKLRDVLVYVEYTVT
jgi:hypothetical protein